MAEAVRAGRGEIGSLRDFLAEFSEAVEADIAHHYPGRSLRELFTGGMSYRELWVFLKHLPIDSWTQTALRDQDELEELRSPVDDRRRFGPWSLLNHQLASLVDELQTTRFVIARGAGFEKYPEPQPVPRPGRPAKPKPVQSEAAVIYLDKLRAKGG